ncbi:MAG: hypothetical protein AAFX94_22375, partial [Myxococcota bacterium]
MAAELRAQAVAEIHPRPKARGRTVVQLAPSEPDRMLASGDLVEDIEALGEDVGDREGLPA